MKTLFYKTLVIGTCVMTLIASGGGGDTAVTDLAPGTNATTLFDQSSMSLAPLQSHQLQSATRSVSTNTGSLGRANDTVSIAGLNGTIDDARTSVTLQSGGTITLTRAAFDFVAAFQAQPSGDDPFFGIVGIPTDASQLPRSGTASYTGTNSTELQIIDGSAVFDLLGDTDVSVEFSAPQKLSVTLSNLDGTRANGLTPTGSVSNVAVVSINDATIANGRFSGGTAEFSSTQISAALSGAEIVSSSGAFFGPSGEELGGVLLIDDTSGSGSLLIQGSFTAKK